MYKVLFVSLVAGKSPSSAEKGKRVRRGACLVEGVHLNPAKKQILPGAAVP